VTRPTDREDVPAFSPLPLHRIILARDISKFCGLAQTRRDELIARGDFPKPVRLSQRRIGWLADEVAAWQAQKVAERDRANGAATERDDTATPAPRWKP
jgi:prophage regulatory protein